MQRLHCRVCWKYRKVHTNGMCSKCIEKRGKRR